MGLMWVSGVGSDVPFFFFCGFLSTVVVGVLLPWICRGGGGFFFDFLCVVVVVVMDFSLIFFFL